MMKKYEIICNKGSLSAGGATSAEMRMEIVAEDEAAARREFNANRENDMYGRQIKTIKEIGDVQ